MKEIQIKDIKGTICFDANNILDKLRVTAFDSKGNVDSHYVFNKETVSNYDCLTYIRQGGRTRFYSNEIEILPSECDYPVSP